MKESLIAPCGMNCAVCMSFLARETDLNSKGFNRTYCEGCLPRGENCLFMAGKCDLLGEGRVRFCFECNDFPCRRLRALDNRYRSKYHLSMLENLNAIQETGMEGFLEREQAKWACPNCGGTICCHNGLCLDCKADFFRENRKYRWGKR